jgi:hypothetical protein
MKSFFFFSSLLFCFPAQAKSIKKMTETELVEVVETNSRTSKRLDAIDELAKRGASSTVQSLANRCHQDPNPEICTRVVAALEQMNNEAANNQLLRILQQSAAPLVDRQQALHILVAKDKQRIRKAIPELLRAYRTQPPPLGADLVKAIVALNQKELADLSVLIAKDTGANRPIRLAALKAAEHFNPPRIWAAWIGLLDDPDSRVRAHCVAELGRAGLPPSVVEPALRQVFIQDVEGNVRAAAAKSLARYAHPGLLPDLHNAVVKERHPVNWKASLDLLLPLANASSIPALTQILERDRARRTQTSVLEVVVRKLARIGDKSAIQYIYAVEQNKQGTEFARACRAAVKSLEAEDLDREIALNALKKDPEIALYSWDKSQPDPVFAPLQVELSAEGQVVY